MGQLGVSGLWQQRTTTLSGHTPHLDSQADAAPAVPANCCCQQNVLWPQAAAGLNIVVAFRGGLAGELRASAGSHCAEQHS